MEKTMKFMFLGLMSGIFISCGDDTKDSSIETPEIVFTKEGELSLTKDGVTIQELDVELAESSYERATGLMYRESMENNQGMLFIYSSEEPRTFYMKNTYIPLDLIFYSKDSSVVSIYENARPLEETSIPSNQPAQFILEVNAGKVQEWNIETGDKFKLSRLQ